MHIPTAKMNYPPASTSFLCFMESLSHGISVFHNCTHTSCLAWCSFKTSSHCRHRAVTLLTSRPKSPSCPRPWTGLQPAVSTERSPPLVSSCFYLPFLYLIPPQLNVPSFFFFLCLIPAAPLLLPTPFLISITITCPCQSSCCDEFIMVFMQRACSSHAHGSSLWVLCLPPTI